jgi:glycosyltransferase involved in cell wall biosynthesis
MSVSTVQDVGRPLITIAITCYNAEDTIQRAVESALNVEKTRDRHRR